MIPPTDPGAQDALQRAQAALQMGDRTAARDWAARAARLDPNREEPWLILAAVASPQASLEYLQRALQINPKSVQARQGLEWATQRLHTTEANAPAVPLLKPIGIKKVSDTQPLKTAPLKNPPRLGNTQPVQAQKPKANPQAKKNGSKTPLLILTILITAICAAAAFLYALPLFTPRAVAYSASRPAGILEKPTLTPTPTATFTPTPSPTFTPTPSITPTPIPSVTPLPTATYDACPAPYCGKDDAYQASAPLDPGRWIDVDLSSQMVYAWEGDQMVNSFLVSSGLWNHPTVTGEFQIYAKYPATLMAGEDYYLPNVPWVMYFYKGYSFHGTYWHHNFGTPMSHGCLNMYTPDAKWLYDWADVGTKVVIHD